MRLASKIVNSTKESPEFKVIFGSNQTQSKVEGELVLDRDALGRLRRELVWTLGEHRMHGVMARLGLSCGQSDALTNTGSSETLLQGMGNLKEVQSKPKNHEYIFEVQQSCEAQEHLRFFQPPIKSAQCWLLSGYLTGVFSRKASEPVYFLESQCVSKGDPICRFVGKVKSEWSPETELDLNVFGEDNMSLELAETREQLKLTKDRYQNLFEQSSVPIVIIDPETGQFIDVNLAVAELTGYTHDELLEMNVFDIRPNEEHHSAVNYLKMLNSGEHIERDEMTLIRKDHQHRIINQTSKILTYGGRRVVQTVFRDVTDLRQSEVKEKDLQHQLLRSERLSSIGRLAAGVAHELKNPLGAIRNAIYYIRGALVNSDLMQTDPHIKEIMQLAESEVDSSVRIIGELLDFSRVVELVPRQTQINDLIEQLPKLVTTPKNVKVEYDLDPSLPLAQLDPDRLKQVFLNIVGNAYQAMQEKGGKLVIRSQLEVEAVGEEAERRDFLVISFIDNGKGIEPIHLKKIFEPLFTTKARGTGLGLAISNNIIEKHGGAIKVTSQVKKGTTFTVRLPLDPPAKESEDKS